MRVLLGTARAESGSGKEIWYVGYLTFLAMEIVHFSSKTREKA